MSPCGNFMVKQDHPYVYDEYGGVGAWFSDDENSYLKTIKENK